MSNTYIRMQCLTLAHSNFAHLSTETAIAAAQKYFDFVIDEKKTDDTAEATPSVS